MKLNHFTENKTMPNPNHPKCGATITVDPIRDIKAIKTIRQLLGARDACLFNWGINTALRASDLLALSVGQVRGLRPGDQLTVREQKTGKPRTLTINRTVAEATRAWLAIHPNATDDAAPLFTGQRGCLTVPSLNRLVKGWCRQVGLQGNYGSHSLRKTWGYHQRVTHGRSLDLLVDAFNHDSGRTTLRYLGIQPEEIRDIYLTEI